MSEYNLDLKSLGPCKSEPFKKLKSSHLQMFFKIGSIRKFAIFIGKRLSWSLFLMKLQVERSASFLKIDSSMGVSCGYYTPPVAASDSPIRLLLVESLVIIQHVHL